jgi:hypothetical protein
VVTQASPTLLWTGTGTLTITRDKSLITTNQLLSITADDFDFHSKVKVSSGSASTVVKATTSDHTMSIGSTSKAMHITDAEFGSFSTELRLEIGSSTSGDIFVDDVKDSNSDDIGLLLLKSTKATRTVSFVSETSSFNKGITVQATGGINVAASVTTKQSTTILFANTGTLTVVSGKVLSTSDQVLVITTDDVDWSGTGTVSTGDAIVSIECTSSDQTIGYGLSSGQMTMESSEFAPLRTKGMIIGGTECGSQVLNEVLSGDSSGIEGVLTLQATRSGVTATFTGTSSTFHAISVQAEDGISVEADVTTTGGALYLDGDSDDSSAGGDIDIR